MFSSCSSSSCNCGTYYTYSDVQNIVKDKIKKLPLPDPKNYKILKTKSVGKFVIVLINYPNCTNYEGNKILVFYDIDMNIITRYNNIDPHFCDGDHASPIARFEPTERGWEWAENFVRSNDEF